MKSINPLFVVVAMVLGIGIGVGVSPWLRSVKSGAPVVKEPESAGADVSVQWKGQLQQLVDVDLRDYYRLKTLEERYKKADEILGKMVLLFLQDLGLRVDPGLVESAKKALQNPERLSVQATADKKEIPGNGTPTPAAGAVASAPAIPAWKAQEKALEEVRTDAEIADFLNKAKFDKPDDDIHSFGSFGNSNGALQNINGDYSGTAKIERADQHPEVWVIQTHFSGTMINGVLQGTESIKISKNGKVFSNSSGSGDLRSLHDLPDSRALVVRVSPTLYFQLYYLADQDQFIGNIYRRNDQDHYGYIGTCALHR